jgi:uncharacterized protein (DUF362 family)
MNRRTFLKWQMHGLLWLGAAPLLGAKDVCAAAFPDVAVAKGAPAAAARAAVEALGGMSRFVRPGQKVVIKPNMSFARGPESGSTTHPEVLRAVLVMCKEAGASRIRVLDHSLQDAEQSLARSGIRDACDGVEPGICRHLMEAGLYREAALDQASEMRTNAFMLDVLEADVIIAVPAAKSHASTGVSLSMKGQMGLIWDRRGMHSRYNLDASIVDLNTRIKPHLAIIDATRVLTSGGPGGPGEVITPGEVIASADPVAADATAVASYPWYGRTFRPDQVRHIKLAHERGLGRMDIENMVTGRITV